jgi:hypothetical protein
MQMRKRQRQKQSIGYSRSTDRVARFQRSLEGALRSAQSEKANRTPKRLVYIIVFDSP